MLQHKFRVLMGAILVGLCGASAYAQMAQSPLLAKTVGQAPNIVLMFDDSGSMPSTALYQYGGSAGGYGMTGPNNDVTAIPLPNLFHSRSPDVNQIYYDPRVTYARRVKADGSLQPAGSTSAISSFDVYFYRSISTLYSVTGVNFAKGALYPASGVTGTFTAAPAGGTTATATITTAPSTTAASVTMNSVGTGYPASGVTATFSAPPAGGITAIGTVTLAAANKVNTVTVNSGGSGYNAVTTATFSAPSLAGGVTATGTVTVNTGIKVTINTPGSGYANTVGVTFSAPPSGGVTATGTVTRTSSASGRGIASINITNPGSGYTSPPTLTLTSIGSGSGATFTVVSSYISAFTVGNRGSGYSSAPTITLSSPGAGAAFTTTLNGTNVVSAINITNPGSGYSSVPTITLNGVGANTTASWTVNPGTTNVIQSVTVNNSGAGYLVPPTFTISAATGAGACPPTGCTVTTSATTSPPVNQDWNGVGTPTTSASYFTPGYTPDAHSPLALGATVIPYPNTASATTPSYPKFRDRSDCTSSSTTCSWTEEVQNYANWKLYHSTRLDIAKTGLGLAFQPLGATFRLGWATINGDLENQSRLAAGVQLFGDDPAATPPRTTTTDFLAWLYARTAPDNTPNRLATSRVGNYFQRKDDNGPWGSNPPKGATSTVASTGTANANHASCRRNYGVLVTDGYYNETFTTPDSDSTTGQTNAAGVIYVPGAPYSDTVSGTAFANSFADVTHRLWFNSLRPDLSQTALQSKPNDTATWPHMNFYAIGLGIVGTLNVNDPAVLEGLKITNTTTNPRTIDWPTPTSNNPKAIDDMWHATINGRGLLLNAGTADNLRKAIKQVISDVSGLQDSQAGVAASATSLSTTTKKYTPLFTSQYWTGDVQAHWLNATTGNEAGLAWEVETKVSTDPITGISTYSSTIPAYGVRNIVVGNGATSGARAVAFNYGAMSSANLTSLMTGTVNANLINYLRGDDSNEATVANVSSPTAIYRPRQTRLGDIINSTPKFVKDNVDLTYDTVPGPTPVAGGGNGYRAFVDGKKFQRKEGVLFVGANDGMLHGFRDGSTVSGGNVSSPSPGGIEVFAYVPHALLPKLNKLADDINFTHTYFVDGPLVETDTYFPTANRWANMVLGTTGAGAGVTSSPGVSPRAAVYAIDTTDLTTSVTGLGTTSVAWEVSSELTDFDELGHVLSEVQSGPTLDGSWVAIFGNGFESKSCKAQLFIVNIETGALIKKIDTGAGSCGANKNGLGGVGLVRNSLQQVIGVYAGDLLGNMWKFDLKSALTSDWKLDFGGDPLYKTSTGQPITAPPAVIDLSTTPASTTPKPGYMVVFGTGKFFETSDLSTTTTQSIYGVWDEKAFGASTLATNSPRVNISQLIVAQTTGTAADGTNPIDFTTNKGWYVNLPSSGERSLFEMPVLKNRFILDNTLAPQLGISDPCITGTGGSGTQYIIDALSGRPLYPPVAVPPEPPPPPIPDCISNCTDTTTKETILSSDPTARQIDITCAVTNTCPIVTTGTVKVKRREWRQLFVR